MVITWLDFGTVENYYFGKSSLKISDVFFQGQTLFWPYLRNGWFDWCEKKRSALVGHWVQYMTLTFDLTHDFDLGVSRSGSEKLYLRNGAANWWWTKRMWVIHSWPWYWLVWPWWSGRMYRIAIGVTSDVGVPLTYLVDVLFLLIDPRTKWLMSYRWHFEFS